jgi:hypothetical protein
MGREFVFDLGGDGVSARLKPRRSTLLGATLSLSKGRAPAVGTAAEEARYFVERPLRCRQSDPLRFCVAQPGQPLE